MGKFLDAAEIVLRRTHRPMNAKELIHKAKELRLLDFSNGKTPYQTMKAKLSVNIRCFGQQSRFMRSGKGLFALREFEDREYKAPPFQKTIKSSEDVLVFSAELLDRVKKFNGISHDYEPYAKILLNINNTKFMSRILAETDPVYKQVLSYVIVKWRESILRFVRGSYTSVQTYLRGRYCIGFGGHVQSRDMKHAPLFSYLDSGYRNSVYRELTEELRLPPNAITDDSLKMIGVLNDDSSDLGRLHFAFIHLLQLDDSMEIPSAKVLKREKSINNLKFVPIKELGDEFERYEYWSKLCIKKFFQQQVTIGCWVHPLRKFNLRKHCNNIAVIGCIGSGKTEACRLLERKYGYSMIPSGRVLQQILSCSPINEIGRQEFQKLAFSYIQSLNNLNQFADSLYKRIAAANGKRCVIDGLRNLRTFELLKRKLNDDITLIYVDSTVDNSYAFFKSREGAGISFEEFLQLLQHPAEQEVQQFIQMAKIVFYNHGGKTAYLRTIDEYFEKELN